MKTFSTLIGVSILCVAPIGCGNKNPENVGYKHVTNHLTPEMKGLSETHTDDHTAFRTTSNQNWRLFWDDLGRALLLDTPSHSTPMPVINTSGVSR